MPGGCLLHARDPLQPAEEVRDSFRVELPLDLTDAWANGSAELLPVSRGRSEKNTRPRVESLNKGLDPATLENRQGTRGLAPGRRREALSCPPSLPQETGAHGWIESGAHLAASPREYRLAI